MVISVSVPSVSDRLFTMAQWMQDTVMLGADFYETDAEAASLLVEGTVPIGIGENTKIKYK